MPSQKLTAAGVERIRPPKTGRKEYFDSVLPGFALRVTDKGRKSWCVMYRIDGRLRRLTLGGYPALGLADARKGAREALLSVSRGTDPVEAKAAQDRQENAERANSFEAVAEEFLRRHGEKLRPRSLEEVARPVRKMLIPRWKNRLVTDISRRDIIDLMDDIMDAGTPVAANRTLAVVKTLFNWCIERGILDASPAAAVKRPAKEEERQRVLTDDEIAALWPVWEDQGYPFGGFHKILLVTAQRRGEVATMCWDDLDFDTKVWHIPGASTKTGRSHDVPLSPLAIEVLTYFPRFSGGVFVFSTTAGKRPISGFSKAKARADARSGVTGWGLHDLRRTAGTRMTQLSI
ncbi:MAG: integrase arm-type DNA-binding domain-containing protein, partial [Gammaproteobacteria bacterium]|nr:integrase arm-type DNA-binding domain-containing protein [Gammaproteobacteria bacterium]